jgi:TadE-like protein
MNASNATSLTSRTIRWLVPSGGWFFVGSVAVAAAARPTTVCEMFGVAPEAGTTFVVLGALLGAMGAFLAVAYRLIRKLLAAGRDFFEYRKRTESPATFAESGVVMIEFALIAPTVWWIMAMVVQMALIAQASLVVRYAAYTAARSAIVLLERDSAPWLSEELTNSNENKAEKAAKLVLCSLSPKTAGTSDSAADAMRDIFAEQNGIWGDSNFHQRFEYADPATNVTIDIEQPDIEIPLIGMPIPIPDIFAPSMVKVTVTYQYLTKIPGMSMISGMGGVAPNGGWAFPVTQVVELQGVGARQGNAAIVGLQAIVLGELFP